MSGREELSFLVEPCFLAINRCPLDILVATRALAKASQGNSLTFLLFDPWRLQSPVLQPLEQQYLQKYEKWIQLKEYLAAIVAFLPYLRASKPYLSFLSGGIKERKLVGEKRSKLGAIDTSGSSEGRQLKIIFQFSGECDDFLFHSQQSSFWRFCHNIVPELVSLTTL